MNSKTVILAAAVGAAVLPAAACASSPAPRPARAVSHSASASPAPAAPSVSGYPQQAADQALCNTYQTDIASGDLLDLGQAVQQAEGSVTPSLANDMLIVVNNPGTVSQDEKNMIYVGMDCALVHVGKPPAEMNTGG